MAANVKEKEQIEESNPITKNAEAGDKAPKKLTDPTPGQSGPDAENLGGPVVVPDDPKSIGKAAAAKQAHEGDKSIKAKPSKASGKVAEEVKEEEKEVVEEIQVDVSQDVNALLHGEELSEEFQKKAATIFEAAVKAKVVEQVEKFESVYEEKLQKETDSLKESMEARIDAHLDYVAEQWVEENEVAVENILRTQIAESFMSSMKENFVNHYIEMPEGKTDMFDEIQEKCTEFENKVTELEEANTKLQETVTAQTRNEIVRESSEGLVDTQAAKFKELVQELQFESADKFQEKVSLIKESYFSNKKSVKKEESKKESNSKTVETVIVEEVEESTTDPLMDAYIKAAIKHEKDMQ